MRKFQRLKYTFNGIEYIIDKVACEDRQTIHRNIYFYLSSQDLCDSEHIFKITHKENIGEKSWVFMSVNSTIHIDTQYDFLNGRVNLMYNEVESFWYVGLPNSTEDPLVERLGEYLDVALGKNTIPNMTTWV